MRICEKDVGSCNTQNSDGHLVTIQAVNGWNAPNEDCDESTGCVSDAGIIFENYDAVHLEDIDLIIEHPAYDGDIAGLGATRVCWSSNPYYARDDNSRERS